MAIGRRGAGKRHTESPAGYRGAPIIAYGGVCGVLVSLVYVLARRLLELAALRLRSRRSKDLEIVVLRHEPAVLCRQVARPKLSDADRVFLAAASRLVPRRGWSSFFVQPEPFLRWHRRLVVRR